MHKPKSQNNGPKIEIIDISKVTPVRVSNWDPNNRSPEHELYLLVQYLSTKFTQAPKSIVKISTSLESLFNYTYQSETLVTTKYLSEDDLAREVINQIINSEGDKLIVAPMGLGKSFGVSKMLLENNKKVIFAVPLLVNVDQFHDKLKDKQRVRKILNTRELNKVIKDIDNVDMLFCVYDKVHPLVEGIIHKDLKNWILVIDEAHNFVSLAGFRALPLRKLWYQRTKFSKVIYLTGTPEVLLKPLITLEPHVLTYKFIPKIYNPQSNHYKIFALEKIEVHKFLLYLLMKKEVSTKTGLTIIIEENIDNLKLIQEYLIAAGLATDNEIVCLNSSLRDTEEFKRIVSSSSVDKNIKYLLSTSVISDGLNLSDTNAKAFYSINWKDMTKLRQMQSRLRDADANLIYYDIINIPEPLLYRMHERLVDINDLYDKKREPLKYLSKTYSSVINSELVAKNFDSFYLDDTIFKCEKEFMVDDFALYHNICNAELYNFLSINIEARAEFVVKYFNFIKTNVKFKRINKLDKEFTKDYQEVISELLSIRYDKLLFQLVVEYKTPLKIKNLLTRVQANQTKKAPDKEELLKLLEDKLLRQHVVRNYREMLEAGFPAEFCTEVLRLEKQNYISKYDKETVFGKGAIQFSTLGLPKLASSLVRMKVFYDTIRGQKLSKGLQKAIEIAIAIKQNYDAHTGYLVWQEIQNELSGVHLSEITGFARSIYKLEKGNGKSNKYLTDDLTAQDIFSRVNIPLNKESIIFLDQMGLPT